MGAKMTAGESPTLAAQASLASAGHDWIAAVREQVESAFVGKPRAVELALVALLARGHVLVEDVPGMGKTTLARALTATLALSFQRIQFTSDMLPSDVVGVSVFDESEKSFVYRPGPLFAHVLLADEINRTTPRTQSALLEAMNEQQVTVDGQTRALPDPFMVLATQNPLEHAGTYPLPESQLDRFLLRITIGYPDRADEERIIRAFGHEDPCANLEPVADLTAIRASQSAVAEVRVSPEVMGYVLELVAATRQSADLKLGVSTRGAIALVRAAQSQALLNGRDYVQPDDVKGLALPVWAHRVSSGRAGASAREDNEALLLDLLDRTPCPV